MDLDCTQYTNWYDEWINLGLDKTASALWKIHYEFTPFKHSSVAIHNSALHCMTIEYIKTKECWDKSPHIFIIDVEGQHSHWVNYKNNIYVWDATFNNHEKFTPYFWWIGESARVEMSVNYSDNLIDDKKPNKIFECMLGEKAAHRDFSYNIIMDNPTLNKDILLSYVGKDNKWLIGNENDITLQRWDTTYQHKYRGNITVAACCFLPWKVYNASFFTLISETCVDRVFPNEKVAKPMLAGRLFITLGPVGMLDGLRSVGFKTFGCVIDEGYDDEVDDEKRWTMALQQVENLCNRDPYVIIDAVKEVTLHNRNLALGYADEGDILFDCIREIQYGTQCTEDDIERYKK